MGSSTCTMKSLRRSKAGVFFHRLPRSSHHPSPRGRDWPDLAGLGKSSSPFSSPFQLLRTEVNHFARAVVLQQHLRCRRLFFTPKGNAVNDLLPKNIGFGFHPEGMAESSRGVERSEDPRKTVLLSSHPEGMPESVNSGAFSIWTEIGRSAIPPGWRTG
jgi:hypothetical protein